ncbi:MAG: ribonuclease HII [Candidatus Bipolaricaulota bacterium]
MPRAMGVDEAGRGAVLGPLVVAGVVAEGSVRSELRRLGAQDSKAVARSQRREILRRLVRQVEGSWAIVFSASQVDNCSLTQLEETAVCALMHRLGPEQLVIDAPVGPAAVPALLRRLRSSATAPVEIAAYPKADISDPLVGAASLLAKVVRDGYLHALRAQYGDIGWGYPGEKKVYHFLTSWLAEHGQLPPICRTRWASVQALISPTLSL